MTLRIEISLSKIQENAEILSKLYGQKGISLMGVSKAVLGEPAVASAMIRGGIKEIADSRLENIKRMKQAGVSARFVLLRTALSQAEAVVSTADLSLNSEMETLKALSSQAKAQQKKHQVMIMVEMGDLREGVVPDDLVPFLHEALTLPHLAVVGIGCNLACYGGVVPNESKMGEFSCLVTALEQELGLPFKVVSGGNSANYNWFQETEDVGRINNLRMGESILLGCETLAREAIPGLHQNAFQLVAEVIEAKWKPSLPSGQIGQNAFGQVPLFKDQGMMQRVIVALGRQDTLISGIAPLKNLEILGASSDHVILDGKNESIQVGSELRFSLDYGALLAAMTSPFVQKQRIP